MLRMPTIIISSMLPIVCAAMTLALDDNSEDSPNALMNRVRAGFKCSPRFSTVAVEWAIVHIWFAIPTAVMIYIVASIVNKFRQLAHASKRSVTQNVPKPLVVLGSLASSVFVINLAITLYSVPLLAAYANDSKEWLKLAQRAMVLEGQEKRTLYRNGTFDRLDATVPPLSHLDSIPEATVITLGYALQS
jgi:hypothetical protein